MAWFLTTLLLVKYVYEFAWDSIKQVSRKMAKSVTTDETAVKMCKVIKASHVNQSIMLSSGQLLKWVDIAACLSGLVCMIIYSLFKLSPFGPFPIFGVLLLLTTLVN